MSGTEVGTANPLTQAEVDTFIMDLAEWEDPIKCESNHGHKTNRVCSGEVTHRHVSCTVGGILVCQNHAIAVITWIENRNHKCVDCMCPAQDCWKVYPV